MHALDCGRELLREFAVGVVEVPVPGFGHDQALRGRQAERVDVGDEREQRRRDSARPATMPNSAACLIELMVSPPALASPMIFAFEDCACSRNDEKSVPGNGWRTRPTHLAAVLLDHRRGVALERVTEGIVGGEEEPGVAAGLHDRLAGAVGERPGVVGPVDRVGRAFGAGQVGGGRARDQEHLVLVPDDLVDRERDRRGRHVDDDVDLVDVDPRAHDVGADVRLVLVVGADDLDLHALGGGAEILDRHARGDHRARPGRGRHRVPDMSVMTPILTVPSLYCACAEPHPRATASAARR